MHSHRVPHLLLVIALLSDQGLLALSVRCLVAVNLSLRCAQHSGHVLRHGGKPDVPFPRDRRAPKEEGGCVLCVRAMLACLAWFLLPPLARAGATRPRAAIGVHVPAVLTFLSIGYVPQVRSVGGTVGSTGPG